MLTVPVDVPLEGREDFTQIAVFRRDARGVAPITYATAIPARTGVPSGEDLPPQLKFSVQKLTLRIVYCGVALSVYFGDGDDPLTAPEVAAAVAAQVPMLSLEATDSGVCLVTSIPGEAASLLVEAGDAATLLELPAGITFWGRPPHLDLRDGVTRYSVRDPDALDTSTYSYRLVAVNPSILGNEVQGFRAQIPGASTVLMRTRLVRPDGGVARGMPATVYVDALYAEGGFSPESAYDLQADSDGYLTLPMRPGAIASLSLPGTRTAHRFKAPTTTPFDPFDPAHSLEDDAFAAREPVWGDPARGTL